MFGGGETEPLGRIGMMASSILSSQQPTQQPQWGQEETRELIAIRGELERDFTVSKRTKALWEVVSAGMRERGYIRTPDQCKCKWKNLLSRYKVTGSLCIFGIFRGLESSVIGNEFAFVLSLFLGAVHLFRMINALR
ncbi:hypothetical protein SLEP1_g9246 [Rubroshorea leprosula]|uniref:Myb-like domain-containing protein n=1 Tax=Rubroshorea leprosula TaxID=152421 RepID=A0AAV5IAB1_9ROSI|nr:hypothetical protein SLEP1_g9246 [Rubroshorea leprosula]